MPLKGTIKRIVKERGFGFIQCGREEYFFHSSGVLNIHFDDLADMFDTKPRKPIAVTFTAVSSPKGMRAEEVTVDQDEE